jgi:antitoxin component YwqK of YwqJK toxin-antitoxin module
MRRVPHESLSYSDDHVWVCDGKPFSGVGVESTEEGEIVSEIVFVDGREHGEAVDYYPNGALKSQTLYVNGLKHGVSRDYLDDGTMQREDVFEYDVLMESKCWSPTGELENEFKRPADDELSQLVATKRAGS